MGDLLFVPSLAAAAARWEDVESEPGVGFQLERDGDVFLVVIWERARPGRWGCRESRVGNRPELDLRAVDASALPGALDARPALALIDRWLVAELRLPATRVPRISLATTGSPAATASSAATSNVRGRGPEKRSRSVLRPRLQAQVDWCQGR